MSELKLWYSPSPVGELAWLIPFVFWGIFNTIVFKIAHKRWKQGKSINTDIMRLSIPASEMILFGSMVLLHLPVCVFHVCQAENKILCGYVMAFITKMTRYVVTYTTTAIIIDLHGSISDPLETKGGRLLNRYRAWKIITFVWLLSALVSVPRLFPYDGNVLSSKSATLEQKTKEVVHAKFYHLFLFITQYLIPLCIITPLSIKIIRILNKRRHINKRASARPQYAIVAIVAFNFICLSPYHLYRLFAIVLTPNPDFEAIQATSHVTTKIMFCMFPLNALLYWGLHPEFLENVKELFSGLSGFKRKRWTAVYRPPTEVNSTSNHASDNDAT